MVAVSTCASQVNAPLALEGTFIENTLLPVPVPISFGAAVPVSRAAVTLADLAAALLVSRTAMAPICLAAAARARPATTLSQVFGSHVSKHYSRKNCFDNSIETLIPKHRP